MHYPLVALAAAAIGSAEASAADTPANLTIPTPSGPVSANTWNVDPTPQEITPASAQDVRLFHSQAHRASDFAVAYLGVGARPSLESLDKAFRKWQIETEPQFSEQEVVEILGSFLGNELVVGLDMEWVVVKDQYGVDYGVRARKVEVMAFPFSSVEKRVKRGQSDFMVAVYYAVSHMLKDGEIKAR